MVADCRLYLLTPPVLPVGFHGLLPAALDAGDVACVQLRLKGVDEAVVLAEARSLLPLCHARGVALVVNDAPELATAAGADGVHVGQDDASARDARAVVGTDRTVGVSCHASRHLAIKAAEGGADYVAFGAHFASGTKLPVARAGLDLLSWWSEWMLPPCVAIGGITAANCAPLVQAGADFLAVCGAVWTHPKGPGAAVAELNAAVAAASFERTGSS